MQKKIIIVFVILISCFAWGCGNKKSKNFDDASKEIDNLGIESDFTYERIMQKPGIIIDREGYQPTGKKVVYLYSKETERKFFVMDMENKEIVYEGNLSKVGKDGKNILYLGDFSEFSSLGKYRIYQRDLGYSHEFIIDNALYRKAYISIYNQITSSEYKNTGDIIYVLANLMTVKEIYGNTYSNSKFIDENIDLLLKHQDLKTGAVYQQILSDEDLENIRNGKYMSAENEVSNLISLSATAEFAGVMAQYYNNYAQSRPDRARECIKAANRAYIYMDRYKDNVFHDSYYFAASQLYKATGVLTCRMAIALYDSIDNSSKNFSQYNYEMLADMAYLKSTFRTDYNRCDRIMSGYLCETSEISSKTHRQHFYVPEDIDIENIDVILSEMMKLGVVSYVLSGREYASIQGNYLHYLAGVNKENVNYLMTDLSEDMLVFDGDIFKMVKLLFVLGNFYSL